jgi:hypothetical protein
MKIRTQIGTDLIDKTMLVQVIVAWANRADRKHGSRQWAGCHSQNTAESPTLS